jgi:hypothetical protein
MADNGSKRFERINAIVKRRWETGAYGNAHFRLPDDLYRELRESSPPPKPSYLHGGPLGNLLSIPVVLDEELPPGVWRLVDNSTKEILFEGSADG